MRATGSRPRSFVKRYGSTFGSPSARATSRILLAERGVAVSYETVRRWVNHFGPMIAAELRKRRLKPHTTCCGGRPPTASMCQNEVVVDLRKGDRSVELPLDH
jgi:hypothetical protein